MATANISKRFCIVYITCPKIEVAESLAKMLLEKRTIACANVLPNVTSIYRWNGEIKQDPEVLMLKMIKTRQDKLCALKSIVE
ncbi:divalent ion tolerance protein, partial [Rozella allomycis CSF55]